MLGRLEEFYDDLTLKERAMLVGMVLAVILFIAMVLYFLIASGFEEQELRIDDLRRAARLLERNRGRVEEVKASLSSMELKASRKPPMLQGYIDNIASKYEFSPNYKSRKPKDLGEHGEFHEESVEVSLHGVPLKEAMKFLEEIEKGMYLIMITELSVNPRRSDPNLVDVTMVVSSFYKLSEKELKEKAKNAKKSKGKEKK